MVRPRGVSGDGFPGGSVRQRARRKVVRATTIRGVSVRRGAARRPTVFRSTRTGLRVTAVCLVVAAIGGVAIASEAAVIAGLVGVVAFAGSAVEFAWGTVRNRPDLVVSDRWVEHRAFGRVAWETVDHVRVRREGEPGVDIVLRHPDPEAALATLTSIPLVSVDAPLSRIVDAIRKHRPDVRVSEVAAIA